MNPMKKLRDLIATAALLGMTATPALAAETRTYSKSTDETARTMSVSSLPNGARAEFEGVECAALETVVGREALARGLDKDVACADGAGIATLYGDVTATTDAFAQAATEVLDQPSQVLTAAEVANERAMVNAVKARLLVSIPGSPDTPYEVILRPGRGDSVEIIVDISQFDFGGQPFFRQEKNLAAIAQYVPLLKRTGGYDIGLRLSTSTASSDMINPTTQSGDRIQLCLENGEGVNNPCVDNYLNGTWTVTRIAQNDWTTALRSTHAHKLNGRDQLTLDNLSAYVIADKVCDDVDVEGVPDNCKNTILALTRKEAVENYRGELTCVGSACGTAVMTYTSEYDGTGKLTDTSRATLETTDPDWTFNKEIVQYLKSPEFGEAWGPFEGMTTPNYRQESSNLSSPIRYTQLFADDSQTHLEP